MTALLLDRLSQTCTRASGTTYQIVLETAAHGTVRTTGAYTRAEIVQDRASGRVEMMDASPVALIRTADAPDLGEGDVAFVDGRLYHVRSAPDDGTGFTRLRMQDGQRTGASWDDAGGAEHRVGLYPAGGQDPSGGLAVDVGGTVAAIALLSEVLGIAVGTALDLDDGTAWTVSSVGPWAGPYARLWLARTT